MRLLRAEQVAQILQIPKARIYELARRKVIPPVTIGRLVRFDENALRAWIDRGGIPITDGDLAPPDGRPWEGDDRNSGELSATSGAMKPPAKGRWKA